MAYHLPSILHIGKFYPPHRGGIESHVYDLATRQARLSSVRVIVSNDSAKTEVSNIDGVQVMRLAKLATIASMPVCPGLVDAISRSSADIVHLHVPNPGAAFSFLASNHRGRLVVTHHADTLGRECLRRLSDPFVRRTMQHAHRIIVSSKRYLASSEELEPFRDKCEIIPLGIEPGSLANHAEVRVDKLRERFGEIFVLAVGRLVPYKGFDILIRAMRYLDVPLVLIGDGPVEKKLRALARAEGVTDRVHILKFVDHVTAYLCAASIFVLPSITRAEAFGLSQLEAMAAGVPVVNTNIDSGVPEVSIDGQTGLTVPPGDVISLARAIKLLLTRPDLRRQFGAAGRVRATAQYSADLMSERVMGVYKGMTMERAA